MGGGAGSGGSGPQVLSVRQREVELLLGDPLREVVRGHLLVRDVPEVDLAAGDALLEGEVAP